MADLYLIDYHLHTSLSGHAEGNMEEYVETAIRKGLKEIGFCDHAPLPEKFPFPNKESLSIPLSKFPSYVKRVLDLRKAYPEIKIKLGCEIDYIPNYIEETLALVKNFPFDYLMLSLHFLGKYPIDHPHFQEVWEKLGKDRVFQSYFETLGDAISLGEFDVLAHPDLPKKFGYQPSFSLLPFYKKISSLLRNNDMVVEVNTAGLRKPVSEIYPSLSFLHILKENHVPVTFGSDAHSPKEVGWEILKAYEWAKSAGYSEFAIWERREYSLHPIGCVFNDKKIVS